MIDSLEAKDLQNNIIMSNKSEERGMGLAWFGAIVGGLYGYGEAGDAGTALGFAVAGLVAGLVATWVLEVVWRTIIGIALALLFLIRVANILELLGS